MAKDASDDGRVHDDGDKPHPSAAALTNQSIDAINQPKRMCPPGTPQFQEMLGYQVDTRMLAGSQAVELVVEGVCCPVIPDLMLAFVGNQLCQSFQQFDRIREDDEVVFTRAFELGSVLDDDALCSVVAEARKPEGMASYVAKQLLQFIAMPLTDPDGGVYAEAWIFPAQHTISLLGWEFSELYQPVQDTPLQ